MAYIQTVSLKKTFEMASNDTINFNTEICHKNNIEENFDEIAERIYSENVEVTEDDNRQQDSQINIDNLD